MSNPFGERGRITDPSRFVGRWRELGAACEQLERRRPLLLYGPSGSGRSSLLTHLAQAAGAVLEIPNLNAFYLDLALLPDAVTTYSLIVRALGGTEPTITALEQRLAASGRPVLICLDGVEAAIAAGWGEDLLERLGRLARRSAPGYHGVAGPTGQSLAYDLMVVGAVRGTPPLLSEPFATVRLGPLSFAEARLLLDSYLDEGEALFSADEVRELMRLSAGQPAFLQRAAYHLYETRRRPTYRWRKAYRAELRENPPVENPLPPAIFEAEDDEDDEDETGQPELPEAEPINRRRRRRAHLPPGDDLRPLLAAVGPLLAGLVGMQASNSWPVGVAIGAAGYLSVIIWNWRQGDG
ncbi:ATP-binding protein [Chloroflexus sp.]|uniref:ATP-binding protein n=1 Tax=Chloroflexus sp. TaxID=1904827 RepID=UPI00260D912C|nr:ATP-binding protein [uncultured Chloroflexus sp.]